MAKRRNSNWDSLEPQKSSAAQFITYIAALGQSSEKYELRYEDENIWISQKTLASIYGVEVPNIAYHLRKLFADAEIDEKTSIKEILIDVGDGRQFSVKHYNLQVIIAIGFKIDNERAVQFRKWANEIVSKYTIRGYVLDKPRLKDGTPISNDYFEHLLEDIREIRLSERRFYQKVTDIYATSIDYDKTALCTRRFFATVQNKMHRAVNGLTAAQIIMLERMVNAYLEIAENAAKRHIPMTMEAWEKRLDKFVEMWDGPITCEQVANVTAEIAQFHAESEFEKYRIVQDKLFMSDYDRYLLALEEQVKKEKGK